MNSSPGPDKITYFHLRSCFKANKLFFTEMISRIINNKEYDCSFSTMTIIPIYKTNKNKSPDDPAAFRAVALASTIFKTVEFIYIEKVRTLVESEIGD